MSNNDLYNTSLKFLLKSLDKLEQNKPVNLALVNEINKKYLLMSPYNILAQPSYLLATNVNAVEPINAKEVDELKEIINKIILKFRQRRDKKKGKLQELADAEAAEAAALTARDAAPAARDAALDARDAALNARDAAQLARINRPYDEQFAAGAWSVVNDPDIKEAATRAAIIARALELHNNAAANLGNQALHEYANGVNTIYNFYNATDIASTSDNVRTRGMDEYDRLGFVLFTRAEEALVAAEAVLAAAITNIATTQAALAAAQERTAAARLAL
jgi:hypothetical protein